MDSSWQDLTIVALVVLAVVYLYWSYQRHMNRKTGCKSGDCDCGASKLVKDRHTKAID